MPGSYFLEAAMSHEIENGCSAREIYTRIGDNQILLYLKLKYHFHALPRNLKLVVCNEEHATPRDVEAKSMWIWTDRTGYKPASHLRKFSPRGFH